MIDRIEQALKKTEAIETKLPPEILLMKGMSSPRGRILLNELCSFPNTKYLEIGTWRGSTLISAMYGNHHNIRSAVAMDSFYQYGGRDELKANIDKFLPDFDFSFFDATLETGMDGSSDLSFYDMDCYSPKASMLLESGDLNGVNVYFFDGCHCEEAQFRALTFYERILADEFILVVDDWNVDTTRSGTMMAAYSLGLKLKKAWHLKARFNGDTEHYWNGMLVAVFEKQPLRPIMCPRCGNEVKKGVTVAFCDKCGTGYIYR